MVRQRAVCEAVRVLQAVAPWMLDKVSWLNMPEGKGREAETRGSEQVSHQLAESLTRTTLAGGLTHRHTTM